ncbi:hypothetical protein XENORESO_012934 [Xenotaenia resolanae]|uniref:Uncharacterized protein n=1 Tax=Xenotaenia resolanae TaxID=208358 RepID=A0ABV0W1F2_9TELE
MNCSFLEIKPTFTELIQPVPRKLIMTNVFPVQVIVAISQVPLSGSSYKSMTVKMCVFSSKMLLCILFVALTWTRHAVTQMFNGDIYQPCFAKSSVVKTSPGYADSLSDLLLNSG